MRNDSDLLFDGKPARVDGSARLVEMEAGLRRLELYLGMFEDEIAKVALVCTLCDGTGPTCRSPLMPRDYFGGFALIRMTAYSTPLTITFDATNPQSTAQSILLAEFYRYRGHWRVRAVGKDLPDGTTAEGGWISQARGLGLIA